MNSATGRYLLVVSLDPHDAMTTLFFNALQCPELRVVRYGETRSASLLSGAAAVVFVRGLFEFEPLQACARWLRIPRYYFLDDNFMVLRDQGGAGAEFVQRYSVAAVRQRLRDYDGAWLATPALAEYFRDHRLHQHLAEYPPAALPRLEAARPTIAKTVAFFGGRHLHVKLRDLILPALRLLARDTPLTLLASGVTERIDESPGLTVVPLAYDADYPRALAALAARGVDILVHPVDAASRNSIYKNRHALITANALSAVPVVSRHPPYDTEPSGFLTADDDQAEWLRQLRRAVSAESDALRRDLATLCVREFSGDANRALIARALERHPAPAPPTRLLRAAVLQSAVGGRAAMARVVRGSARGAAV